MTRKKGGGRGSGQRGTGPDPQSFGDEAPSHEQPSGGIVAAANPAAPCPDCLWPSETVFRPEHDEILHERIRELEDAERACKVANESQRKTIAELEGENTARQARIRELEAELLRWKNHHWQEDKFYLAEKARAERAEACMKELEAELRGWHRVARETPIIIQLKARAERAEARVKELEKALRVAMLAVDKEAFREDSVIPPPIANLLHDTLELRGEDRG